MKVARLGISKHEPIAPNVQLQMTLARAWASANVAAAERLNSRGARPEEPEGRRSICNLLGDF
jgi:hypothetical protein